MVSPMNKRAILDAHCHLHEYHDDEVETIGNLEIMIIAVSNDYASSLRTLDLAKKFQWIVPAVGIHPWEITSDSLQDVELIQRLVVENLDRIKILGEIGLDARFRKETLHIQQDVFKRFLDIAREFNLAVNIHSVDTWRDILSLLQKFDIGLAIFHWYTGPKELLKEIKDCGYFISINPAVKIQNKHRAIVAEAPLDIILVESDAPYEYRGMKMHPSMVFEVIKEIAMIKNLDLNETIELIKANSAKILKQLRIPI